MSKRLSTLDLVPPHSSHLVNAPIEARDCQQCLGSGWYEVTITTTDNPRGHKQRYECSHTTITIGIDVNQGVDYAKEFFGRWTPEAFERDGGKFAKENQLFIVSAKQFNEVVAKLIAQAVTRGFSQAWS